MMLMFGFALGCLAGYVWGRKNGRAEGEVTAIAEWSKAFKETLRKNK